MSRRVEPARVLVVQHLEPEGPALIGEAILAGGASVEVVRTDLDQALPATVEGWDGLVVLGGSMSAATDHGFPTRQAELALLRQAVATGLPVLGVCLGAQLLALAGGAAVFPGSAPELGWGVVRLTSAAGDDPLFHDLGERLTVLHWHGDTFDLPPGAVHLARSTAYPNQAFRLGPAAWGLQFHLEADQAAVARYCAAFAEEADAHVPGGAAAIATSAPGALAVSEQARIEVLERFAALVVAASQDG